VQGLSDSDHLLPPNEAASLSWTGVAGDPEAQQLAAHRELAALLVRPGDAAEVLDAALRAAARAVPDIAEWRVYAAEARSPESLTLLAVAGVAAAEAAAGAPMPRRVTTLGFGAAADRLVLAQRQATSLQSARPRRPAAQPEDESAPSVEAYGGLALPLIDAGGVLRGVLVALTPRGEPFPEPARPMIHTVACHATALLGRQPAQPAQDQAAGPGGAADERMAFISLAAHELRSPLTSVKGYAQLLLRSARRDAAFPHNSLRALQSIEQQASRMSDMVAELLDASRIQRDVFELHVRPADLVALARHAVDQRRPSLERHELALEIDGPELEGEWDAGRVEQVIRDLIDNAIRYSPDGGQVSVRVGRARNLARVCVRDEGLGVPAEERERIFDAFYRGATAQRRNLAGLGLGLFVSRAIVEGLGGHIWLEAPDAEASGSTFCFDLPLAAQR
jgi:signal transduction histidine kinase